MNVEKKLGAIVEAFDQKDGPDRGERQAKIYGVRTQSTSPAMGQEISIEKGTMRHVKTFFAVGETILNEAQLRPEPL